MLGKQKCKILKEIRRKIADENDIPYVTRECTYQGECKGTCPRCESELRYLEQQLALRASLGKRVAVAALCAGMTIGISGCAAAAHAGSQSGSQTGTQTGSQSGSDQGDEVELSGEVEYVPDEEPEPDDQEIYVTTGEVAYPDDYSDEGAGGNTDEGSPDKNTDEGSSDENKDDSASGENKGNGSSGENNDEGPSGENTDAGTSTDSAQKNEDASSGGTEVEPVPIDVELMGDVPYFEEYPQ